MFYAGRHALIILLPVRKQPRKNSVEQKRLTSVSHRRVKFALYIILCKLALLVNLSLTLYTKFVCKSVSLCPLVGGRELNVYTDICHRRGICSESSITQFTVQSQPPLPPFSLQLLIFWLYPLDCE